MSKLLYLIFFISLTSFSQVVNIETLRKASDSAKWTGSVSLDVSLIKNKNDIFRIANKAHVQYNDQINLWLFVNDLNFQKTGGNSLVNRGTQHLRYNRKISERVKWEAFTQAQYDAISEIDFRGLVGTGPRFKLTKSDDYRFYLGTLIMYEYEKASNVISNRTQNDLRGSVYLSFSLYPTETISILSTSYYQPKLDAFSDYRFSSNTSLLFEIFKDLAFKTNFNFFYDAVPVSSNIPKTQFELTNGLIYSF
ncbi:DUF481 domain-containing protein [Psychroserpens burtonensis]|uniref:DUF481 domain-containing protein n=1 Tax=Psychroserpens burtonensis TaxID=49278 RepID=A0A5C7B434_9FLAO|nr:DUF481 domain-containing protein [Psychroserpens burtonensis]TXE16188.1 DUF481 domain-containing protein [Psychroserpens burtonensis]